MSSAGAAARQTQDPIELSRVGTCMAWQWMCPHGCGYVLGINADREQISEQATRHLACHTHGELSNA